MSKGLFTALVFIGVNLFIIGIVVGINLYSLTYTAVPVSAQHLWYGTDLSTYLFWSHLLATVVGVIGLAIANAFLIFDIKKDYK